jgi:acyl-CoA thioester hydrolase
MTEIAGHFEGQVHVLSLRVYYEDTDFSGSVYHANYLKFCERGRSDCLRLIGVHHHELQGQANFVVRRMACEFLKPATIDNLLNVETRFIEFAGARMELAQVVRRGDEILFEACVTAALVDRQGRPKRIPPAMKAAFLAHSKAGR